MGLISAPTILTDGVAGKGFGPIDDIRFWACRTTGRVLGGQSLLMSNYLGIETCATSSTPTRGLDEQRGSIRVSGQGPF
jgi:hypothetical protein